MCIGFAFVETCTFDCFFDFSKARTPLNSTLTLCIYYRVLSTYAVNILYENNIITASFLLLNDTEDRRTKGNSHNKSYV